MRLLAIEAAILDGNLALRLEQRRLADDVDDAAIGALAVEHGRGAATHFDAVERVDVDARNGAEIIILPHPVLILDGVEPAHRDGAWTGVAAAGVGGEAVGHGTLLRNRSEDGGG